jgi:inositol transport system ATP-binding protein
MVGRAASELYARPAQRHEAGTNRLRVRGLRTIRNPDAPHAIVLNGVDLDLNAGEILGVAGLVGSGRTELARAIFGADRIAAGSIELDGVAIAPKSPADAIALGIGLVPEDRKHQAIFAMLGIQHNFSIASLGTYSGALGFMTERRERDALADYRQALSIRMASPEQPIEGLSGGNQQKVILARWLARNPKVLIVDEPTRGVDVGAKAEVHQILVQLASEGIAVMVISSELPEVLAVSDRIVTMRQGRITGEMSASDATEENLMALMALDQRRGDA